MINGVQAGAFWGECLAAQLGFKRAVESR